MTELHSPKIEPEPGGLQKILEEKFDEALMKETKGIEGFVITPTDGNAQFIRLTKDGHDYDLAVGRPLLGVDVNPNLEYWIVTIRRRNYRTHGNERMIVLKNEPGRLFEDIGNDETGLSLSEEQTAEVMDFLAESRLIDLPHPK